MDTNVALFKVGQTMTVQSPAHGNRLVKVQVTKIVTGRGGNQPNYLEMSLSDPETGRVLTTGKKGVISTDLVLKTEFITPNCLKRIPVQALAMDPFETGPMREDSPQATCNAPSGGPSPQGTGQGTGQGQEVQGDQPGPQEDGGDTDPNDEDMDDGVDDEDGDDGEPEVSPDTTNYTDMSLEELKKHAEVLKETIDTNEFRLNEENDKADDLGEAIDELTQRTADLKSQIQEENNKDDPDFEKVTDLNTMRQDTQKQLNAKSKELDDLTKHSRVLKDHIKSDKQLLNALEELIESRQAEAEEPDQPQKPVQPQVPSDLHTVKYGNILLLDAMYYMGTNPDFLTEYGKTSVSEQVVRDWSTVSDGTLLKVPVVTKYSKLSLIDTAILHICAGLDTCFFGRAGLGKSYCVEAACKVLGAHLVMLPKPKYYQITGGVNAHGESIPSLLMEAVDYANKHTDEMVVVLIDEIDRVDANASQMLNPVIASRVVTNNKENVPIPDNVRFMATANSNGMGEVAYKAEPMDKSLVDRFLMVKVGLDDSLVDYMSKGDTELAEFFKCLWHTLETRDNKNWVVSYRGLGAYGNLRKFKEDSVALSEALVKGQSPKTVNGIIDTLPQRNRYTSMLREMTQ